MQDFLDSNRSFEDKILLNYFITDYIACGLSSTAFHTEFNKTLSKEKSKIKLIKRLMFNWSGLFKSFEITSTLTFINIIYICVSNNIT